MLFVRIWAIGILWVDFGIIRTVFGLRPIIPWTDGSLNRSVGTLPMALE